MIVFDTIYNVCKSAYDFVCEPFLKEKNIIHYKNYKYKSIDECFLNNIYKKYLIVIQSYVPKIIHPNILSLCGLISIVIPYYYSDTYYGNYLMCAGTILYYIFDGIDGMHARNTKQTSIIGEYVDHIIDIINTGMLMDAVCNQLGLANQVFIKNITITTCSSICILMHYESIQLGCVMFEKLTDVSFLLTLTATIFLFQIQLPTFIFTYSIPSLLPICVLYYNLKKIVSIDCSCLHLFKMKYIIVLYYIIKLITVSMYDIQPWHVTIIDALLLLELNNYKIFKSRMHYSIVFVPILYTMVPYGTMISIIAYILFVVGKISKELNINVLYNISAKKRVYCGGVFDLCHLGHMVLFENIVKSFDEPIELIVGVMKDEECKSYKRKPIINDFLRAETVKHCKYVDQVWLKQKIGATKEFVIENNIDCVIIGEEYKGNKDEEYYGEIMKLDTITIKYIPRYYIPRYEELSTSHIINKIKANY